MTKLVTLNDYRTDAADEAINGASDERAVLERAANASSAQILLFTGVRYERMDEPAPMAVRGRA